MNCQTFEEPTFQKLGKSIDYWLNDADGEIAIKTMNLLEPTEDIFVYRAVLTYIFKPWGQSRTSKD